MKKLICTVLAMSFISNITAYALIDTTFQNTYEIGDGLTYTHIYGTNSSGPQSANVLEYSPSSNVIPYVAYGNDIYGGMNILNASNFVENATEQAVLGGINGDFYTLSTGVPLGLVIQDGELKSSDAWQNAIGFKTDGSVVIDRPGMDMKLYFGDEYVQVNYFNKVRTNAYVYLFNEAFGAETKVSTSGTDIILEKIDDNMLTPTSSLSFKVVDIKKSSSSLAIAENQYILSIDDKISEKVPNVAIGDVLTLETKVSNTEWNDVSFAIGGESILLKDGVVQTGLATGTNPRTAIGVKADGTIVTYEVDGRNSSFSNGLSLTDLALEMQALGCVQAINLDGGGSSSVVVQFAGTNDAVLVNTPSESSLRANSNYIFFLNMQVATGKLDNIYVYPQNDIMLLNASIDVEVLGVDENFYAVNISNNENFGSDIVDGKYTATETGTQKITATYNGITNSANVLVLDRVDSISVLANNTAIDNLKITPLDTIDLNATALYKYLSVVSVDESYKWEVFGDIGEIDEQGVFTAGEKGGIGYILVSYGNYSSKMITVTVSNTYQPNVEEIATFEENIPFTITNGVLNSSNLYVANGTKSAMITYDTSSQKKTTLDIDYDVTGYKYLNFKTLSDGNSIYANFADETGKTTQVLADVSNGEFVSLSIEIPEDATTFKGFTITNTNKTFGTAYIDHVTLSNQENDNLPPIVVVSAVPSIASSLYVTGNIVNCENYTLEASSISILLNGKEEYFAYNEETGDFSYTTSTLRAGLNRLSIVAEDVFGNITIKSYDIESTEAVDNQTNFVDIGNVWYTDFVNYSTENGYIVGEPVNNEWYFNPERNMTRAEFAIILARILDLDIENVEETVTFTNQNDIPYWALPSIKAIYNAGILTGTEDQNGGISFDYSSYITRAEVFAGFGRIIPKGFDTETDVVYSDGGSIPSYAYTHINTLTSIGVLEGYLDNTIRPHSNITRAEICKLIYMLA
ncbi:MAG: phosphodiester glycosidase family protein [Clostridia bacterium]